MRQEKGGSANAIMKRIKQKPKHNHPSRQPAGASIEDADIEAGEAGIADFLEALPVCEDSDTVIAFHRQSDYDTLLPVDMLEAFLAFCADVLSRYEGNLRVMEEANLETQDLLHFVELADNMGVSEGFKAYRRMREVRRVRRCAKNENELLQALYDLLRASDIQQRLQCVLGILRAKRKNIDGRKYSPRTDILTREEV